MNNLHRAIGFACCALIASTAPSQVLPFQSYTVRDGLLSNGVHTFLQDSQGYLWIGTRDGVSVFDGWTFTNYTTSNGLPPGPIKQIFEDRAAPGKRLWILTVGGRLCRFVDGLLIPFSDSSATWAHRITSLGQDHTGTIWVGTEDTLATIVQGRLQPVETGICMGLVDAIQEQGDSLLWIGSRSGLTCYSFRTGHFKKVDLGLSPPVFTAALFPDEEGNLWTCVNDYVMQIRDLRVSGRRKEVGVGFLVQDHRGGLWFGSYAGLYRVRKDNLMSPVDHFTTVNGLSENTLKTAFVDRQNNLWVGGIARGIARLSETSTVRFVLKGINPANHYSIGASDSSGHIWVVTPSGLLETWEDSVGRWHQAIADIKDGGRTRESFVVTLNDTGLVSATLPYSIFIDHRGRLWIGYSNAQLACYEVTESGDAPSRLKLVSILRPTIDFPDGTPLCFIVDRSGMVWYSEGGRILLLDPGRRRPLVRIFGDREGISSDKTYVRALACDRHGNIWAGFFNTGVARLDVDSISGGSFHPFPLPEQAFDQRIGSIREDNEGRVWIASESNGLIIADYGGIEARSIKDGLPSNIVTSIAEDNSGRVWVSTGVGVAYLDSARSTVVHRKSDLADSYVFCSGSTKKGRLWFVTIDGLVVYNPTKEDRWEVLPSPLITSFRANGVELAVASGLNVSYDQNHIEIGFVAISFRDQEDVRYQYRMSGVDPDWHPPGKIRAVTYAALPQGDYTFEVRAFDARGVPGATTTSLSFSIVPPFWRTSWFSIVFWITLAVAGGTAIRFIEIRKTRKRLQELEYQQVRDKERLRISRDMHDEVGASLTEIAILSELARRNALQSPDANEHMKKIAEKSRAVIDSIGEIIWAINPRNDPLENLVSYLHRYAVEYFKSSSITCRFDMPEQLPTVQLTSESRRNVFLVVKEALHNVVKHSEASQVTLRLIVGDRSLAIYIEDNGRGFFMNEGMGEGIGLQSMKRRAEDIGGSVEFESNQPSGTRMRLQVPMANVYEERGKRN